MAKASKKAVKYQVVEIGGALVIRKATGKRRGGQVRKQMRRRPPTKLPVPRRGRNGCALTAALYDHEANTTTFMYDCPNHTSYTVTRSGNYMDAFAS